MSRDSTTNEWWAALNDARPQHQPQVPTVILPGFAGMTTFATLPELAACLAERLAGRRPVLSRSVAAYPGFDSFPAFTVYAEGDAGESAGPRAGLYVATIAVQRTPAAEIEQLLAGAGQTRAAA